MTQKNKRTRVMQYRSAQGPIQLMGFLGLKRLFPNFEKECLASDIRILPADWKQNIRGKPTPAPYKFFNGKLPEIPHWGRAGVESLLRLVHADPTDPSRIQKVSVRTVDGIQNVETTMVADCTGSTAGMKWLERAGYDAETLEAYFTSFDATLDEPMPSWIFEIVSRFKDESVTFTHDAVRVPHGILKAILGAIALNIMLSTIKGLEPQTLPQNFARSFFITQATKIEPMWYAILQFYYYDAASGRIVVYRQVASMVWCSTYLSAVDEQARSVLWHTKMFLGIESLHPNLLIKVFWRALTG
ncbi:hypothetical protein BYT27DRAFT_7238816 [Phlegmacium glaucopus]|nr:hypothetical protein BYT27DRAFT_7238816 [Phlegmacium glaucopus]